MTDTRGTPTVQQLTKVTQDRKAYVRPAAIEKEIEATLALPLHDAFRLAASGHLRPQTLVYLIRNFKPNGPTPAYEAMILAFFSRLEQVGERIVANLPENFRERIHEEVKDKAIERLHEDELDIFECSFKTGAQSLYLTARAKMRLRMRTEIPQEDLVVGDSDIAPEDVVDTLAFRAGYAVKPLAEAKVELQQALSLLTDEERIAVTHIHVMGLTYNAAAAAMGCSDTKVKYLIKHARAKALGNEA